ncbi:MAG TPA: SAM-dependent methyltransferase [Oceanobacillus sp.]|nr:SAM-dependent methyltransferase [Oceanobacillus sp.]
MPSTPDYLRLDKVVLLGRTFDEYVRFFALDEATLQRENILDAASGVSSFCAEGRARGYKITAADAIYHFTPEEIEWKCEQDLQDVMAKLPPIADLYVWTEFPDVQALTRQRERAYRRFLRDYKEQPLSRYVPAVFPQSGFDDKTFTLTLVSHLLFLYEDQLDYAFHLDTLRDLLRITTGEVRIYPITNLRGERSSYLNPLMAELALDGYDFELVPVNYEFLKNANQMLRIHAEERE